MYIDVISEIETTVSFCMQFWMIVIAKGFKHVFMRYNIYKCSVENSEILLSHIFEG